MKEELQHGGFIPRIRISRNSCCSCKMDYNDYDDYFRGAFMTTNQWTVADAKARLSEVMARAEVDGPQTITRNGRKAAVLVTAEEWEKKTKRQGNLAEFFAASPLREAGLKRKRIRGRLRKVEL